jgi:hypothetical protein
MESEALHFIEGNIFKATLGLGVHDPAPTAEPIGD